MEPPQNPATLTELLWNPVRTMWNLKNDLIGIGRNSHKTCTKAPKLLSKYWIHTKRTDRSHGCPTDINDFIVLVVFICHIHLS